jgi:DNA replicative helicase MCM subunit Mcm2 (Cdc46/Mcm family)
MKKILSSKNETLIREIINTLSIDGQQKIPINKILDQAINRDINSNDTKKILKSLLYKGEIYEPEVGFFRQL